MLKKLALALLFALPLTLSAQKFGIVNSADVLQALPGYAEMNEKIAAASKTYETELQNMRTEIDKKYTEFQQLAEDTPAQIKERRMQEIQELDQKMRAFYDNADRDLQQQQMNLLRPLQESIAQAVQTLGQTEGYTFIFDVNTPAFVGADVVDVTPLIKTALGIQ